MNLYQFFIPFLHEEAACVRSTCPQLGAAHCATALGPVSRVLRWPLLQNTFSTYMKYSRRWPLRPPLRGNIEIYDCHTNCNNDNNRTTCPSKPRGKNLQVNVATIFPPYHRKQLFSNRSWALSFEWTKNLLSNLDTTVLATLDSLLLCSLLVGIPSLNVSLFCVKTVNHTNKNRNQIIDKQIADFSWSKGRHVFVAESFPHHVQLISNDPPVASQEPGGSSRIFSIQPSVLWRTCT